MRKVRAVDYNSEYFAWEVEEVEAESEVEEDLVVPSPPQPLGRLRLIINGLCHLDKSQVGANQLPPVVGTSVGW